MSLARVVLIASLAGALMGCQTLVDPEPKHLDAQAAWVASLGVGQPIDEVLATLPDRMYVSTQFDVREGDRDYQYRDVFGMETLVRFGLYFEDGKLVAVLDDRDESGFSTCRRAMSARYPSWLAGGFEPYRRWILQHGLRPQDLERRAFEQHYEYRNEAIGALDRATETAATLIVYGPFLVFAIPGAALDSAGKPESDPLHPDNPQNKAKRRWEAFQALKMGTPSAEVIGAFGQPDEIAGTGDDIIWKYTPSIGIGLKNGSVHWKEAPPLDRFDVAYSNRPLPEGCAAMGLLPPVVGGELANYTVTVDTRLERVTVEVQAGDGVRTLRPLNPIAASRLDRAALRGATLNFGLELELRPGVRAKYSSAIKPTEHRLTRLGDQRLVLSDPRGWLWLPKGFDGDQSVRVTFVLPPNIAVATPWQADGAGFIVRPQMLDEQGLVAIGRLAQREVKHGGVTLRLSVAGGDAAVVDRLGGWAEDVWRTARGAVAAPPSSLEQIVIVPIDGAREAVPWGEVRRGGGNSVLAFVAHTLDPAALREDWTLYHELSHLYLPWLGDDRWLSEGLASYYQIVLRARNGVLSPELGWQQLAEGLARGAAEDRSRPGRTVEQGARMVTYWTGAALALEWDIALRKASGGKDSLDSRLSRFAAAHLPAREPWDAIRFARALDALDADGDTPNLMPKGYFADSMAQTLARRGFPDYLASYQSVGVDPATGRANALASDPQLAIMRPARE